MADENFFDSIGLAGYAVGTARLEDTRVRWAPRQADESASKDVALEGLLRASWAPMGRMCHLRLVGKDGSNLRFDGFKKSDIDRLSRYFEDHSVSFEQEQVESGGGNYGTLEFLGRPSPLCLVARSDPVTNACAVILLWFRGRGHGVRGERRGARL